MPRSSLATPDHKGAGEAGDEEESGPNRRALRKVGQRAHNQPVQILETALKVGDFGLGRQHGVPILLPSGSSGAQPLKPIAERSGGDGVSEAFIQALVQEHPECLPITEIDEMFSGAVPICRELNTPAGPIDNFLVTPSGLPVLVECKL